MSGAAGGLVEDSVSASGAGVGHGLVINSDVFILAERSRQPLDFPPTSPLGRPM